MTAPLTYLRRFTSWNFLANVSVDLLCNLHFAILVIAVMHVQSNQSKFLHLLQVQSSTFNSKWANRKRKRLCVATIQCAYPIPIFQKVSPPHHRHRPRQKPFSLSFKRCSDCRCRGSPADCSQARWRVLIQMNANGLVLLSRISSRTIRRHAACYRERTLSVH